MKLSGWFVCVVILLSAIPSFGQSNSVVKDGKEWLQPVDFVNSYSYDQISAVCPVGVCTGNLPRNTVDLTGYIWASINEIEALFNSYGDEEDAFFDDFTKTIEDSGQGISAFFATVRDLTPDESENYVAWIDDVGFRTLSVDRSQPGGLPGLGISFWRPLTTTDITVRLEEPANGETHSGIGNLRGWAVSEEGVDRVEIFIDGKYMYDAPYGGSRGDVEKKYPDVAGSDESGFSLAFGYSNLADGEHTMTARAYNTLGEFIHSTSTFMVVSFQKDFIRKEDIVDTSQSSMTASGDEILLDDVELDGRLYELRLKWRTAEQGFEIIEIR